ncbi:MAG: hydrogenase iron-sulfur subunit [Gemmatimonadota bacterium]|nr:hydrogenase iron-sulfur subunit [Gemmatimonadota bacterium]
MTPGKDRPIRRFLDALDAAIDRLAGWRYNPLYQSGTIVVALLLVLLVTGIWLLLFYRVATPWESVAAITASRWTGNWVRGVHRFASDAAVLAIVAHVVRMVAQRRTWGPRALAWFSGMILLGVFMMSAWTGFVMVWDSFGRELALEGARIFDVLPILSEPIGRTFVAERNPPGAFFFFNLFLHVALPLGMGALLLLHVSRLARATLLPPRPLMWGIIGLLVAVAIVWPLTIAPAADPFTSPDSVPMDWWFAFWMPLTRRLSPGGVWLLGIAAIGGMLLIPRMTRPGPTASHPVSQVDHALCTGCYQCSFDCPFTAITMVPRSDGRAEVVAEVDPDRCVSCGICAGSCAPMGVGPPGRTGRDQLARTRPLAADGTLAGRTVVIACEQGAWCHRAELEAAGVRVLSTPCVGNLHSSVVEIAIRGGARGVLVLSCPPRDCQGREGPKWLVERLFHDREAELQARVDRRRVAVGYARSGAPGQAMAEIRTFAAALDQLDPPPAVAGLEIDAICEPAVGVEDPT